ncbi:MAG: hypothetical protein QM736_13325 [Vicinamibacterales bacterium]
MTIDRGLAVTDTATTIVVGNLTFSKSGSPLLASVSYRGEGIRNGHERPHCHRCERTPARLSKAQNASLDVVKGGPLLVVLKYTASLPIDETTTLPVELVMEMPNSKSWVKTTATV